jgi:hypothetical protein
MPIAGEKPFWCIILLCIFQSFAAATTRKPLILSSYTLAKRVFLSKPFKQSSKLVILPHLDISWEPFATSKPCWKPHFVLWFFSKNSHGRNWFGRIQASVSWNEFIIHHLELESSPVSSYHTQRATDSLFLHNQVSFSTFPFLQSMVCFW